MDMPSRRTILTVLSGLLAGLAVGLLPSVRDAARPAIVMESLREGDHVAVRGGSIELVATVRKQKDCRVATDRWLTHRDADGTLDWWPLEAPHAPPVQLGDGVRFRVHIPLPPDVPPGLYAYRARATDECGLLPAFLRGPIRDTGDIPIRITNPTPAEPALVKVPPGPFTTLPSK